MRADDQESQWEVHEGDYNWLTDGDELYDEIRHDMWDRYSDIIDFAGYDRDQFEDAMFHIWFDAETTPDERNDWIEIWYDMGLEYEDFPWEEWAEWYDAA